MNRPICGVDLLVCLLFLLAFSSDLMLCHCRIGGDSTWGCFTPKLDTHSSSAPRPTVHFCTTLRSRYTVRVCIGERVVALGEACAHQVTSGMSASRFHEYCYLLLLHLPFSANPRPSRFVSLYCTPTKSLIGAFFIAYFLVPPRLHLEVAL